jgi:hypothetical protein
MRMEISLTISPCSQAFGENGSVTQRLRSNGNYKKLSKEFGDNQPLLLLKVAGLEADGITNSDPQPEEPDIKKKLQPWRKDGKPGASQVAESRDIELTLYQEHLPPGRHQSRQLHHRWRHCHQRHRPYHRHRQPYRPRPGCLYRDLQ